MPSAVETSLQKYLGVALPVLPPEDCRNWLVTAYPDWQTPHKAANFSDEARREALAAAELPPAVVKAERAVVKVESAEAPSPTELRRKRPRTGAAAPPPVKAAKAARTVYKAEGAVTVSPSPTVLRRKRHQ